MATETIGIIKETIIDNGFIHWQPLAYNLGTETV